MDLKEQIDSLNKILEQVEDINQQRFYEIGEIINNLNVLLNKLNKKYENK